MGTHFVLFAGVFVDEGRFVNGEFLDFGWQWDWAHYDCAGFFCGVDDEFCCVVDYFVIEGFYFDADLLLSHGFGLKNTEGIRPRLWVWNRNRGVPPCGARIVLKAEQSVLCCLFSGKKGRGQAGCFAAARIWLRLRLSILQTICPNKLLPVRSLLCGKKFCCSNCLK